MMMSLVLKVFSSLILVLLCTLVTYLYYVLWLGPERKRERFRRHGIGGPPPSIFYGNIQDMKKLETKEEALQEGGLVSHNYAPRLFPYFERWRKDYGPVFLYSLRNMPALYVSDPDLVKEISSCKSICLGKPSHLEKEQWHLLGRGVMRANGPDWAHQRKIIAPEFFIDKVKAMMKLMVDSTIPLLKSWEERVESEGGVADIRVDEDLRSFSADVISRACFGSSYSQGKEIFSRLKALRLVMTKAGVFIGIPLLRYLPTKKNRKIWRMDREVRTLILKVVKERRDEAMKTSEKDLLQTLVETAGISCGESKEANSFLVDNCKNIYFAGHETSAVAATWSLMLLALNPHWQARARVEIVEICGQRFPDAHMIRKLKTLTMVIQEALRLYPPSSFVSREALEEMRFGDLHIPKGTNIWIPVPTLHQDTGIWGSDAHEFNPERFANGIVGACKLPHTYMPFGFGPRTCLGQNMAMIELKVLLSLILSRFSISLSPNYRHSPTYRMVVEPEHGLNLLIKRV